MNDLRDQWRNGPGQELEARGRGGPEAAGPDPASMGCAGRGPEKALVPGSVHPWGTEVSRGPARGLSGQLSSCPVTGFVIYYTRSKEITRGSITGTQLTWAAQTHIRKSWSQNRAGEEMEGSDLSAAGVTEEPTRTQTSGSEVPISKFQVLGLMRPPCLRF